MGKALAVDVFRWCEMSYLDDGDLVPQSVPPESGRDVVTVEPDGSRVMAVVCAGHADVVQEQHVLVVISGKPDVVNDVRHDVAGRRRILLRISC